MKCWDASMLRGTLCVWATALAVSSCCTGPNIPVPCALQPPAQPAEASDQLRRQVVTCVIKHIADVLFHATTVGPEFRVLDPSDEKPFLTSELEGYRVTQVRALAPLPRPAPAPETAGRVIFIKFYPLRNSPPHASGTVLVAEGGSATYAFTATILQDGCQVTEWKAIGFLD